MLMVCRFVSTMSLVGEWVLWFLSVNFVFEILLAAVGFCPTDFFLVGVSFGCTGPFEIFVRSVVYIEM